MPTIGVKALQKRLSRVIAEVEETGQPTFVTHHGRPAAVILPVDEEALEDYVLAHAPEFVKSRREADEAVARGRTRPARAFFAELKAERGGK